MKFLKALAAALRLTVTYVWERSVDTGRWIARAVSTIGADGEATVSAQDMSRTEAQLPSEVSAQPAVEDWIDRVQRVCRDLNRGKQPSSADRIAMAAVTREWLATLTPGMRLVVGNAERDDVAAHLSGKRAMRGMLAYDKESIKAYREAMVTQRAALEGEDPEYALAKAGPQGI